jgi:hypothetical protein
VFSDQTMTFSPAIFQDFDARPLPLSIETIITWVVWWAKSVISQRNDKTSNEFAISLGVHLDLPRHKTQMDAHPGCFCCWSAQHFLWRWFDVQVSVSSEELSTARKGKKKKFHHTLRTMQLIDCDLIGSLPQIWQFKLDRSYLSSMSRQITISNSRDKLRCVAFVEERASESWKEMSQEKWPDLEEILKLSQ